MSKVILAGNGSSVLDHNLGSYIDSEFDLVYRMNRFKTKGFEEYVGSRVDGWFAAEYFAKTLIHPDEKIEGSLRWKDFKYVFLCMPKFKYSIESVRHLLNENTFLRFSLFCYASSLWVIQLFLSLVVLR